MEQAGEIQTVVNEDEGVRTPQENAETSSFDYKKWIQIAVYSIFVIAGLSTATILGRVFFRNEGKSVWLECLVGVVGFPLLFMFQWVYKLNKSCPSDSSESAANKPSAIVLFSIYVSLGILVAAHGMFLSIGIQYLPLTTFAILSATNLGFGAIFSYFLNAQKLTPYIMNSIVLLTISTLLLAFQSDSQGSSKSSKKRYLMGCLFTLAASVLFPLVLSLTQLSFEKMIKKQNLMVIINMTIYLNIIGTSVIMMGIFASGDWRRFPQDMKGYKQGRVSFVMNLFWTAVSWQLFGVGCIGLVFEVSSLYSNVINMVGIPIAPIVSTVFLNDKFTEVKAVSMVLAMWGLVSYVYHHYLEELEMRKKMSRSNEETSNLQVNNNNNDSGM